MNNKQRICKGQKEKRTTAIGLKWRNVLFRDHSLLVNFYCTVIVNNHLHTHTNSNTNIQTNIYAKESFNGLFWMCVTHVHERSTGSGYIVVLVYLVLIRVPYQYQPEGGNGHNYKQVLLLCHTFPSFPIPSHHILSTSLPKPLAHAHSKVCQHKMEKEETQTTQSNNTL